MLRHPIKIRENDLIESRAIAAAPVISL